ncbi:precorrin-6y C5,15-methyltransferase (decarboxylating) subunit CbiE [Chloroflexota bacterium]
MNKVYIIGVGPGASEYMTGEAEEAVRKSDIVVGWEFDLLPPKSLINGKKVFLQEAGNYIKVAGEAADEARKTGETVAVLRIGDPCISGGLNKLLEIFHDFEVDIVPGISSTQIAAATARINLDESVLISFHENEEWTERNKIFMLDAYRQKRHLIIISGPGHKPHENAVYLMKNGIGETTPVVVCESLSLEDEKIFRGTLKDTSIREFSWLSIMVVIYHDSRTGE